MKEYKQEFIEFLLEKGALQIGDFTLKSGRKSPYFINTGLFTDGHSIERLGNFYATETMEKYKPKDFDIIFGPAYKGITIAAATVIALNNSFGVNKEFCYNRKEPKQYGEGINEQKNWIVGAEIEDGNRILMVDDVFTTGDTKYDSINLLKRLAKDLEFVGLIIAVDRQEVGKDGRDAIGEFEEKNKSACIFYNNSP